MSATNWGDPEVSKFIRKIRKEGWSAAFTGGNHIALEHPEAHKPVFIAGSPGARRWKKHTRAEMRRQLQGDRE